MTLSTVLLAIVVAILTAVSWKKDARLVAKGWRAGLKSLSKQLPLILIAFAMAGYIEVLVPSHVIQDWMGAESGFRGILIGSIAGGLLPFGPYVVFPMASVMYSAGAGAATLISFVTGWMLWSSGKLAFEFATLGPMFTLRRMSLYLVFPPMAGFLASLILR